MNAGLKPSYFSWGALPYPHESVTHAAENWQRRFTVDHNGYPFAFLFCQERGYKPSSLPQRYERGTFIDENYGLALHRGEDHSLLCAATGCKSGIGAFLKEGCGVINMGPQFLPLGETDDFGIVGRPAELQINHEDSRFSLSWRSPIAATHPRETGLPHLKDAIYSGMWALFNMTFREGTLCAEITIDGYRPLNTTLFSFFCKATLCQVGDLSLRPCSLDRYEGPAQSITLHGQNNSLSLAISNPIRVIPLAGGNAFWGSDFLIAAELSSEGKMDFSIH